MELVEKLKKEQYVVPWRFDRSSREV